MSEIRALENLRGLRDEAASKMVDNPRWVCARAEAIADEIEAEVVERFMELPVDADGVPIHVGDMMEDDGEPFTICAVAPGCVHRWHVCNIGEPSKGTVSYPPISLRHYVPDSIGRIVQDMRDSISPGAGLAYDEVLVFVERLEKRLERLGDAE